MRTARSYALSVAAGLALAVAALAPHAPRAAPAAADEFARDVAPLLQAHCARCHGAKKKSAGVDFSAVADDGAVRRSRKLWRKTAAQVESLQMPPKGAKPLPQADRERLLAWLGRVVNPGEDETAGERDPGPGGVRRLSVAEYDNTVRDLLGVVFDANEEVGMTEEGEGGGLANLSASLDMSPSLLEKYFAAADRILDRLFGTEPRSDVDGAVVDRARRARERLFGLKPDSWRDPKMAVRPPDGLTGREASRAIVSALLPRAYRRPVRAAEVDRLMTLYDRASAQGLNYVDAVRLQLKAVLVSPRFLFRVEGGSPGDGGKPTPVGDHELATRLSYFLWSSMPDEWLTGLADRGVLSGPGSSAEVVRLGGRALGGPVALGRVDRLLTHVFDGDTDTFFESAASAGAWVGVDLGRPRSVRRVRYAAWRGATDRVVGGAFQASRTPDFSSDTVDLFTVKNKPANGLLVDQEVTPAGQYRYVRFVPAKGLPVILAELEVWGTAEEPVLEQQARRMLADPRAAAITENFAARWLQLNKLAAARPSTEFFPEFQPDVRKAMYDETATFFDGLRQEDRDLRELLDADYTYVNEDLARFYQLPPVKGKEMRRVSLPPGSRRGGLLGMGSVLALTSHTSRTSPTLRGKWVLDVIFGTPPPPPPPDAGLIKEEPEKGKEPRTFREKLAQHAADASCVSCHRRLDPLGFALENYNAVGQWRERDGTRPLDTSGVLPTGERLAGARELKAVLQKRQGEFVRNLTEQLFVYALGRELDYYDDGPVRQAHAGLARDGHRFSALVLGVVQSYPFRYRRAAGGAE